MHHVRLIEAPVRNRIASVADMNHRGLGQRRQQLVGRLRGEHRGPGCVVIVRAAMHREAVLVQRVEPRVAIPGFVEVQAVYALAQQLFDPGDVVGQAVVGGVGDDGMDRRRIDMAFDQRVIGDRRFDAFGTQGLRQDRADDAETIAGRHQIGRDRARQRHRMFGGLVAIAVAQGDLIASHAGHEDDAVGHRRAVGHVIRAMSAKHLGRIALTLSDRTAVVEQRTQFTDGDRQVRAQQIFAKEFVERPARRAFQKRRTARMARRVPGIFVAAGELQQRAEHRWQNGLTIALDCSHDPTTQEAAGVFGQPDEVIGVLHDDQRDAGRGAAITDQKYRHAGVALSQCGEQIDAFLMVRAVVHFPAEQHALNRRIGTQNRLGVTQAFRREHTDGALLHVTDQLDKSPAKHAAFVGLLGNQQRQHAEQVSVFRHG